MSGSVWVVRAPKGTDSAAAVSSGLAPVDVGVRHDVSGHDTLEEMMAEVLQARPDLSPGKAESRAATLLTLTHSVQADDLVIVHGTGEPPVSGVCSGETGITQDGVPALRFTSPQSHSRSGLGEDVLNSMRTHIALSRMRAPDAFERLTAIRQGHADPGPLGAMDDARAAGARISAYDLADLVADLLRTDGYHCRVSPPGPDGGVDIYAGRGILGIGDSLLVQVKSGSQVVSAPQVYQILGNLKDCGASATLIVSWSGFTADARRVLAKNPFLIVGWTFDDLIQLVKERSANVADRWHRKLGLAVCQVPKEKNIE